MLYIHGIGHFHPENEINNDFLQDLDIGVDVAWVLERVGIQSRRTVLCKEYIEQTRNLDPRAATEASMYSNAQTGARAAKMALLRAGIPSEQIGWVVAGGCSPQWLIPAEACTIAAELGMSATAFDINSACSSFILQMSVLEKMGDALPDFVLVVNAENTTRTIDYSDRRNAVLWGDGSVATIVSSRVPSSVTLTTSGIQSDPAGWNKITIRPGGRFDQDGSAVQAFAIRTMVSLMHQLNTEPSATINYFVGHQANLRALESVAKRVGLPDEAHLFNVDRYGNCGAAGPPSVISQRWEQFKPGDNIAVAVVGAGLTWGGMRVEFANREVAS